MSSPSTTLPLLRFFAPTSTYASSSIVRNFVQAIVLNHQHHPKLHPHQQPTTRRVCAGPFAGRKNRILKRPYMLLARRSPKLKETESQTPSSTFKLQASHLKTTSIQGFLSFPFQFTTFRHLIPSNAFHLILPN
ncbi:hypothetical protein D9758_018584 [Tetrapyrgos nigripes]|uniref:Uncharacterized protein n=1 Tax=Tetrapyrgos nigripes TaxID=182062 RepID=A0A8H5BS88_9AGAR|nr:hypothetical protein D9758_018584 [Tetrapyrgos nigripes]